MECMYCKENDFRRTMMEEIFQLPSATVMLFRDQRYYGRCVVAFRGRHVNELHELTPEELFAYSTAVAKTAKAVQQVSGAAKLNYAIYGDKVSHVHVHIVPKQRDGEDWGGPFRMDGTPKYLEEEEWNSLRAAILRELEA